MNFYFIYTVIIQLFEIVRCQQICGLFQDCTCVNTITLLLEINCIFDNKTLFNFTKFHLYFPNLKSIKDFEKVSIKSKKYQMLPDDVFS